MKTFFVWCLSLFGSLCLWGQTTLEIAPDQYDGWASEALFTEAENNVEDLDNAPSIRLQYAEIGLQRAKDDDNKEMAAKFATKAARVYTEVGLNRDALTYAHEALRFSKQTPDRHDEIWALFRMSEIHFLLRETDQALSDARKALSIAMAGDSIGEVGWSYITLGEHHRRIPNYDSAEYAYLQALAIFEELQDPRGIRFSHQNLALTYTAMEQYDKATEELNIVHSMEGEPDLLALLEEGIARVDIISNRHTLDSAIIFAMGMEEMALASEYPIWIKRYKALLSDLCLQAGDWPKAWAYHLAADSLEEAQTGEQIRLQARVVDHQYRVLLFEAEQELLSQQSRNSNLLWISVILVLGLLGVVTLLQVTKNKRIRTINTELSERNQHLDTLLQEKDIWTNLMVHDLKAPLNSIGGLLEVLSNGDLPGPVREKALNSIKTSVHKGSELISHLLEISRLESGKVKVNPERTDVTHLVGEVGTLFQPTAENKGIHLEWELPEELVFLTLDPVHTQRILENFVSNAIKFSFPGTKVRIVLAAQEDQVAIRVIDQGPGLSEKDQQNLFQKFKKLSARPTGGESSTGLGLSIVKLLADRIGAEIQVESVLGEGATFSLVLPKG